MRPELADVLDEAFVPAASSPEWALVVGSVDRRLARPLGAARVVMNMGATGLALPRDSFDVALCLAPSCVPAVGLEALVVLRNALTREGSLFVVGEPLDLAPIDALAESAGFSRKIARALSNGYGVLDLRR